VGGHPAGTFHTITDPAFYGSTRVCFLDGRFVFNRPGTNQFYLSPSYWDGMTAFDPLYIASKVGGPDRILSISVIRGELWLIGNLTTEVWFNAGGADFPFERQPGVFIDHGLPSTATRSPRPTWRSSGWGPTGRASASSSWARSTKPSGSPTTPSRTPSRPSAPRGLRRRHRVRLPAGRPHLLCPDLPHGRQDLGLRLSTGQWHERVSFDIGGNEHRWRPSCVAFAYNLLVAGDYTNGKLYLVDMNTRDEDGQVIWRRRGFPHLLKDQKRISYSSFIADMEVGSAGDGDLLFLRWSDTRGKTWGTPISISMGGLTDNNYRSLIYRRLGMARDRVFELYWFFPAATALNGAEIETEAAET
jgi:hypothetical protein